MKAEEQTGAEGGEKHLEQSEASEKDSGFDKEQKESSIWWSRLKLILLFTVVTVGLYFFLKYDLRSQFQQYFDTTITPWIDSHPISGPLVYMGIYIVAVVAFLPGSIVTLAGGALFGPIWGTVYVSIASTIGAGLAFLVARFFAKEWIEKKAGDRMDKIQEGIRKEGWRFVAFTRLVPLFPFNLQNYMYGLTRVGFWTYFLVSWVAMLPGTFAYVYAGYATRVAAAGGKGVKKTFIIISIAAGVLILMSLLPRWLKKKAQDEKPVEEKKVDESA